MGVIKKMLKQRGVYLEPAYPDGYGTPVWNPAVECKMRFVYGGRNRIDPIINNAPAFTTEKTSTNTSTIFTDLDMLINGLLWLASRENWGTPGNALAEFTSKYGSYTDPSLVPGIILIKRYEALPNFKCKEIARIAYG